jgi:hypothetical protein
MPTFDARLSATIDCFCSSDQRRRCSPRMITSMRCGRVLIRSLISMRVSEAVPVVLSAALAVPVVISPRRHTSHAPSNVGAVRRSRHSRGLGEASRYRHLSRSAIRLGIARGRFLGWTAGLILG